MGDRHQISGPTRAVLISTEDMPAIKLTYFNGRGRGETARLCFAVGGVSYEDCRVEQEDWPAMKESTPWGTLPLITVGGKRIGRVKRAPDSPPAKQDSSVRPPPTKESLTPLCMESQTCRIKFLVQCSLLMIQ